MEHRSLKAKPEKDNFEAKSTEGDETALRASADEAYQDVLRQRQMRL